MEYQGICADQEGEGGGVGCGPPPSTEKSHVKVSIETVIHLQFWAYGSWDSLFPISMSPTANF